jgi:hypothetical protein
MQRKTGGESLPDNCHCVRTSPVLGQQQVVNVSTDARLSSLSPVYLLRLTFPEIKTNLISKLSSGLHDCQQVFSKP